MEKKINWEQRYKSLKEEFENYKLRQDLSKEDLIEMAFRLLNIDKREYTYGYFLWKLTYEDLCRLIEALKEIRKDNIVKEEGK